MLYIRKLSPLTMSLSWLARPSVCPSASLCRTDEDSTAKYRKQIRDMLNEIQMAVAEAKKKNRTEQIGKPKWEIEMG